MHAIALNEYPSFLERFSWSQRLVTPSQGKWLQGTLWEELPELRMRDGMMVPPYILVALLQHNTSGIPVTVAQKKAVCVALEDEEVTQLLDHISPKAMRELGPELLTLWGALEYNHTYAWLAWSAMIYGGDTVRLEYAILMGERFQSYDAGFLRSPTSRRRYSTAHERKTKTIWQLGKAMEGKTIPAFLCHMHITSDKWRKRVEGYLNKIARHEGLKTSELRDKLVPLSDLTPDTRPTFHIGGHTFVPTLTEACDPVLKDETGHIWRDLPDPIEGLEDEEDREKWHVMQGLLKVFTKLYASRLATHYQNDRRWLPTRWRAYVLDHPIRSILAQHSLWGSFARGDDSPRTTWRVCEDLSLADADDEEIHLADDIFVGLVHPDHLPDEVARTWQQVFLDYEIIQDFNQLGVTTAS